MFFDKRALNISLTAPSELAYIAYLVLACRRTSKSQLLEKLHKALVFRSENQDQMSLNLLQASFLIYPGVVSEYQLPRAGPKIGKRHTLFPMRVSPHRGSFMMIFLAMLSKGSIFRSSGTNES
jgi:hypothetical protein